jgi:intein-encoded DNA endonuclease-like protein
MKIAEIISLSRSYVRTLLIKNEISLRTRAESHRKYLRTSFSGSMAQRAYLLGFAIGDLRVRKQYDAGETIGIACSSTHPAQIKLINELFSSHGHVWISEPNVKGVVSCEAFVDLSFSFLLKKVRIIEWVFETETYFYAFLSGFTDAEGSIFFTKQGKIVISWGQYDKELLEKIRITLNKYGCKTGSVISDNLAGYIGKDGYARKQDYYKVSCAAQESLLMILLALKPYIRHDEKKQKLTLAVKRLKLLLKNKP